MIVAVACVAILAAGLSWWMQRFELNGIHEEIKDYLAKHAAFNEWEAGHGGTA